MLNQLIMCWPIYLNSIDLHAIHEKFVIPISTYNIWFWQGIDHHPVYCYFS